jgi:metal-responsive CopG/Arc/MetJ family transcriptional regulator
MNERTPRILLLLPDQLLDAIDAHQREAGIISRNETIRRLLEAALKAAGQRQTARPQ